MPYRSIQELPEGVKNVLPKEAQEIYKEAYNNAAEQYKDPSKRRSPSDDLESTAHKVAWGAVKKEYQKNEKTGKWKKK